MVGKGSSKARHRWLLKCSEPGQIGFAATRRLLGVPTAAPPTAAPVPAAELCCSRHPHHRAQPLRLPTTPTSAALGPTSRSRRSSTPRRRAAHPTRSPALCCSKQPRRAGVGGGSDELPETLEFNLKRVYQLSIRMLDLRPVMRRGWKIHVSKTLAHPRRRTQPSPHPLVCPDGNLRPKFC